MTTFHFSRADIAVMIAALFVSVASICFAAYWHGKSDAIDEVKDEIIYSACYNLDYIRHDGKVYVPVCVEMFKNGQ